VSASMPLTSAGSFIPSFGGFSRPMTAIAMSFVADVLELRS
jgi:hypothetical protein